MQNDFSITLHYNGQDLELPAKLVTMGYTYKIFVQANDVEIVFEPDEERHLRAIIDPFIRENSAHADHRLINAIGVWLQENLNLSS